MCNNQLIVRDGLIFYAWLNDSQRRLCLLVPKAMQQEVLHCCHDMKSSAHLVQDKTLQQAKQHYMWYRMSQDCRKYVQSGSVCNKNKKSSVKPKAPLQRHHAGSPMERVHLDILGPFTPSEHEMLCPCYDRPIHEVDRVCSIAKPECTLNCQGISSPFHCDFWMSTFCSYRPRSQL